jgi:peptidoglycan/xylan/chitin deacetylase (PgdA/CDA1 family)
MEMRRYFILGAALLALLLVVAGSVGLVAGEQEETIWGGTDTRHAVALTFDDGPSSLYTPRILALLKKYGAHATFFVLGEKVEKSPWLIKQMLRNGNEVGNHSFSHPRLTKNDQSHREMELERTALDLDLLGCSRECRLVRPPYSAFDQRLTTYLAHTHRRLVLWNIDSGDWRGLDTAAIVKNVLSRVRNGAIIVFHDSDETGRADRTPTGEALKVILPALWKAGYRMVTVSELVGNHEH